MDARSIIFYILSAIVVGGGLMSVTSSKIFRSAVFLLFSLIGIAGLYFYLDYEFIAAVQIVVYVGGIVVLMIFSIFLTSGSGEDMKRPVLGRAVFSALAAVFGCMLTMYLISQHIFLKTDQPAIEPTVLNIGTQMLNTTEHGYILPFEVVSMLLLAAMIGCIVIAIKVKIPAHQIKPEAHEGHVSVLEGRIEKIENEVEEV